MKEMSTCQTLSLSHQVPFQKGLWALSADIPQISAFILTMEKWETGDKTPWKQITGNLPTAGPELWISSSDQRGEPSRWRAPKSARRDKRWQHGAPALSPPSLLSLHSLPHDISSHLPCPPAPTRHTPLLTRNCSAGRPGAVDEAPC